jgi:hypothetical protein
MGIKDSQVLIGATTYDGKEYAFNRWLTAVKKLGEEVLVVDTSETMFFYDKWYGAIPMIHLDISGGPNKRISEGMEYLREYCVRYGLSWLNVETDVIVPEYILSLIPDGYDAVSVPYLSRKTGEQLNKSFGCTWFSKDALKAVSFRHPDEGVTTDAWFQREYGRRLKWNVLESAVQLQHLVS